MIYWAPFLHFYQPSTQFHAILKKVTNESYRPLLKMFLEHPYAKVTINICGVLTELLNNHGAEDVIADIKKLALNNQLEFVDSGKYHPILPLISQKERKRQIELNHKANKFFFGNAYKVRGFFPPEMCYSDEVGHLVASMGYDWILLSGIACSDKWPLNFISSIPAGSSSLKVFFRDDVLSNKISFRNIGSAGFLREIVSLTKGEKDAYIITAMDAETFGHHIRNWEKLFLKKVYETIDAIENTCRHGNIKQKTDLTGAYKKIFFGLKETPHIQVLTISELINKMPTKKTKVPRPSSWSSTKEDIVKNDYYPLWKGIKSQIHELQWEHVGMCFEMVDNALSQKKSNEQSKRFAVIARGLMDKAIYSCQFWWANKERGTWDINLINKGLMLQEEVLLNAYKSITLSSATTNVKKDFYHKFVASRDIASKIRDLIVE